MNFPEFYTLLNSIIVKNKVDVEPSNDNFNLFLAMRYLSFYHPSLCVLMNEFANNIDFYSYTSKEIYDYLFGMVPKLKKKKIEYIRRNTSKLVTENGIDDEDLAYEAKCRGISKREFLDLLNFSQELEKSVVK